MAPQRTYAAAATAAAGVGKKKKKGMVDPRLDNLRVTLYPRTRAERGEAPTGVHRPDVVAALERTLPSTAAHETITRAFRLFARRQRVLREEALRRKCACMRTAMADLEREHPAWYREARVKVDPRGVTKEDETEFKLYRGLARAAVEARSIEGFFPRELRVPVDTPPRDGWQYDWEPPRKYKAKE
jgi:large subunit ribosomal protein L40